MAHNLLSSVTTPFPDGFKGLGPLGDPGTGVVFDIASATAKFELALTVTIGVMTVIATIWFVFSFIAAAISWIAAGSDKQAVQNAQKKIANSLIGLLIVVVAIVLTLILGQIVGFENILNPAQLIQTVLNS